MGFATTILIALLSLTVTWKLDNFFTRIFIVLTATFIGAYLSYWVIFWIEASDQAESWQWITIHLYFLAGSIASVIGSFLILIIKKPRA